MKSLLLVLSLVTSLTVFGHGDHHHKDRLPPAPHGGHIQEALSVGHDNDAGLFMEVKKTGKSVAIYPLMLSSDMKSFVAVELSKLGSPNFKLIDPRKKKNYNPSLKRGKDNWSFSLKGISGRRFIVDITTAIKKDKFRAKVQFD